jgi:MYXO-CTERM domain-containing protein
MITRPNRWIVCAILLLVVAGVALADLTNLALLSGPTATAQVNVPYSSAVTATGGLTPYAYAIVSGSLPPGLNLSNPTTGAITGTPTTAGVFTFTAQVTDSQAIPQSANSGPLATDAARRSTFAQGGNHGAFITSPSYTITVSAAPSPTPVPPSVWMALTGLAGAGLFRLRQKRRA